MSKEGNNTVFKRVRMIIIFVEMQRKLNDKKKI